MRIVSVIGVVTVGMVLASCSGMSAFLADNLPEWVGGLPQGTPPRRGAPGYDAYVRALSGDHHEADTSATAVPAAAPQPPPRESREPIDDRVH